MLRHIGQHIHRAGRVNNISISITTVITIIIVSIAICFDCQVC